MLNALMGGQSLTATELAYCANVSRATASGHLSKLVAARLLTVTHKHRFQPPAGSAISVATKGDVPVITIPQPREFTRYFIGAFMLFWLGGWFIGFRSASSQVLSGNALLIVLFWLGAWTLGETDLQNRLTSTYRAHASTWAVLPAKLNASGSSAC